jgi:hypothetical protein
MNGWTKEGLTEHYDEQVGNENKAESEGSSKNWWSAMEDNAGTWDRNHGGGERTGTAGSPGLKRLCTPPWLGPRRRFLFLFLLLLFFVVVAFIEIAAWPLSSSTAPRHLRVLALSASLRTLPAQYGVRMISATNSSWSLKGEKY